MMLRVRLQMDPWFAMHYFGIAVVMAWVFIKKPKDFPLGYFSMAVWTPAMIAAGFFGARLFHAILRSSYFYGHQNFWQRLQTGGFGHLGTLAMALLVILCASKLRFRPASFFKVADYVMPFMFLEQAFGRIGCFFAGCCYGCPTSMPWGVVFRNVGPTPRHPAQIYYAVFIFAVFFIARHIYKKGLPDGVTFFSTFAMYGFFRFFGEFVRVDSPVVLGPLKLSQMAMIVICLAGASGIWYSLRRGKR